MKYSILHIGKDVLGSVAMKHSIQQVVNESMVKHVHSLSASSDMSTADHEKEMKMSMRKMSLAST